MNTKTNRRNFIKTTATAAAAIGMPTLIPASALGKNGSVAPSNRIVVGGIGLGPRGRKVLDGFFKHQDCQFVAIADVQKERREIIKWCRPSYEQRKAAEALRHKCRMAFANAANSNLGRIPSGRALNGLQRRCSSLHGP